DLADDAGRHQASEARQVHAGLGLPDPLEHAPGPGAKRKDVAGTPKVRRHRGRIDGDVDRGGAVGGRDAGGHPEAPLGVDAHREGGGQLLRVALGHLREAQLVAPLAGERQADEAAAVQRHEVDEVGRHHLGRADEVALVLAILVIGHDDDLAVAQVVDGLLDGAEGAHEAPRSPRARSSAATYLPSASASRCTRSPGRRSPSVVCCKVNGMREIWITPGRGIAFTVRLTPSTVMEPSGTVTRATSAVTPRSSNRASWRSDTCSTLPRPST